MKKNIPANRYINGMSNITYLTGFVRRPWDGGFFLQQNNNMDQLIPIQVRGNMRIPSDRMPVTVLAHMYGSRDAEGVASVEIRAFDIQKPSVRAMPTLTAWVAGSKRETDGDRFTPFTSTKRNAEGVRDGALNEDVAKSVEPADRYTDDEQVLRDILEATRGRLDTRLGDNANVVQLAGFVASMTWVEPNEFQENGYGAIMLRQHEDLARNIPIRLYAPAAKVIMKNVAVGLPISIVGQIRMKTIPNDAKPGEKISRLFVRVNDLYSIDKEKDIKELPEWWTNMRDNLVQEFRIRQDAQATAKASRMAKPVKEDADLENM